MNEGRKDEEMLVISLRCAWQGEILALQRSIKKNLMDGVVW